MRALHAAIIGLAVFFTPLSALADSGDASGTIAAVDTDKLVVTLDDGKTYQAPEEFNFDGLAEGVKVEIFYTEIDGKRVIDDLAIVQ